MGDFIAEMIALILALVTLIIEWKFIKDGQSDFRWFLFRRIAWAQYAPPANFDIKEAVHWVLTAHIKRDTRKTIEIGDIILPVKFLLTTHEKKKNIQETIGAILEINRNAIWNEFKSQVKTQHLSILVDWKGVEGKFPIYKFDKNDHPTKLQLYYPPSITYNTASEVARDFASGDTIQSDEVDLGFYYVISKLLKYKGASLMSIQKKQDDKEQ